MPGLGIIELALASLGIAGGSALLAYVLRGKGKSTHRRDPRKQQIRRVGTDARAEMDRASRAFRREMRQ